MTAAIQTDEFDIGPNRNIFYVAFMFLIAGLVSGSLADIFINAPAAVLVGDLVTFGAYVVILTLVRCHNVGYSKALSALLLVSLASFYFSFAVNFFASETVAVEALSVNAILTLMITGLFGAIATLVIDKRATYLYGTLGVIGAILLGVFRPGATYFAEQAVMDLATMLGTLMVVFYYRKTLEDLMTEIRETLLRARQLKNKAEEFNEINRPFAVFGRNAASLAADFRTDVEEVRQGIESIRKAQRLATIPEAEVLRQVEHAVRSLNRRIEWVKFATSASEDRGPERLSLRDVVESAVYPFMIQEDLREKVRIDLEVFSDSKTVGRRLEYLHVIESLIRGICDVLVERRESKLSEDLAAMASPVRSVAGPSRVTLKITLEDESAGALIRFAPMGTSFPVCMGCQKPDCSDCAVLRAGAEIPALSQPAFKNYLENLQAVLRFRTKAGSGTVVELALPRREVIVSK